jgi:Integrase core domain
MLTDVVARRLSSLYYDAKSSASFGGSNKLRKAAIAAGLNVSLADVKEWLSSEDTYTLHKPRRKRFPRNKTLVYDIDDLHQADLAEMQADAKWNDGVRYLLVVIDCLSKYLWVRPLTDKTGPTVAAALEDLYSESGRMPKNFQTDKGREWLNVNVRRLMRRRKINFYTSQNPESKSSMAERVIRTLKGRIYRYCTSEDTRKYLPRLQALVDGYNAAKHRTIDMAPKDVTQADVAAILARMFPAEKKKYKFNFTVGDYVRLAKERLPFDKEYRPTFTDEIFVVARRHNKQPTPTYSVRDMNDEPILGTFYEAEIQRVTP